MSRNHDGLSCHLSNVRHDKIIRSKNVRDVECPWYTFIAETNTVDLKYLSFFFPQKHFFSQTLCSATLRHPPRVTRAAAVAVSSSTHPILDPHVHSFQTHPKLYQRRPLPRKKCVRHDWLKCLIRAVHCRVTSLIWRGPQHRWVVMPTDTPRKIDRSKRSSSGGILVVTCARLLTTLRLTPQR